MKVSLPWLNKLVDNNLTPNQLADLLSLKSIGVKDVNDDFLELDLTYNRGDLLSLRGIAREVAAITNQQTKFEPDSEYIWDGKNLPKISVEVQDNNLCPVYCVAKIEDLKVDVSLSEVVKKLASCGIRSVDNITDVTNLMMLEYGQPLHSFDAGKVKDQSIVVRAAKNGEKITSLDGKKRDLSKEELLITDSQNTLAIAGVMGGENSGISSSTSTILLEAAIFDPVTIRNTSKKLGLYSEASKRFQHGLSKTGLLQALSSAIKMYQELGGKLTAVSLFGDLEDTPKIIELNQEKINSLLGINLTSNQVETNLASLGFHLRGVRTNAWDVEVPYWRLDINIEEDLIEEIARMYGYEKIEGISLKDETVPSLDQSLPKFIYDLKTKIKGLGLTEIQTYSFYSSAVLEALGFAKDNKDILLKVANPISSETEYMRADLWPNLVEAVGKNIRQGFKDIAIFEIGKVYSKNTGKPKENYRLSIAFMNSTENPLAELNSILKKLNIHTRGMKLNPVFFHPKRIVDNCAEVHLKLLNRLGIEKRVAIAEIDFEPAA